jgi:curved DNA-binding protein
MQSKDFYKVLGVPRNASQEDIRKAFRKLAREHHPDVAADKKAAEARFKEINEANEVLGDPEKRARYDEMGATWNQPQARRPGTGPQWGAGGMDAGMFGEGVGPGGSGQGLGDFFEKFFASTGGAGGQPGRVRRPFTGQEPLSSRDIEGQVNVSIEELVSGTKRTFTVTRGSAPPETIQVNIPKGMHPGQRIRVAGKGAKPPRGGTPGDLYLTVQLEAHNDNAVEGSDIVRKVAVPVFLCVLGGEVDVETPEGVVRVKVPEGTQPGRRLRLRGRGLPVAKDERGDFFAEIQAVVPTQLSAERRRLWERIGETWEQ